ncbi:ABC transporter ATP-binding protein [Desulfuromonas carbonis]|uniref:ABC transporter ATP-binding protein n=1 Tax=Desulfuromonas sp. DDH964 TaxID=1823759 RepID=UPI00078DE6A4|nr:ATP-binding cassette domain-containing protein [Desulfuromonas sp. DDH964]AMV71921.1 branched-chain amino acid ABC transporter ATP-binding protein [Desulfuromonas sp. DDH964]
MTAILETRGLTKSFGAVTAAANINVVIHESEVVGVIGSNGAGKTTFINMVTGYLKPSEGEILFRGKRINGCSPRQVTRTGICRSFQVAQLFPELTVLENMLIACRMLSGKRLGGFAPLKTEASLQSARAALVDYGIEEYAEAVVATLPQGVRKLLDIAMAMVGRPALLLLDEPTSGVAIDEKFGLMDTVMNAVGRSGAASLFVEHDMEIISRYATRVIAFYDGHVIADAPTAEALEHPDVREYIIGAELHRQPAENHHHA